MRSLLVITGLILFTHSSYGQFWQETFTGLTNGVTSDADATPWTTTLPSGGAASFSKQTVSSSEEFQINDTGTEGVWQSGVIDISSHTEVAIEVTMYSRYTSSSDYIRCYYKLNGGAEIQFGELTGINNIVTVTASAFVSGSTLQVVVRGSDNTAGSTGSVVNSFSFDNVTLSSIQILYSRSSGNWGGVNTWSTAGLGGASCGCTPGPNARVIIGNNNIVTIPSGAPATAAGVTVESTGRLQLTAFSSALDITKGGTITVANGGQLNNNGLANRGSIRYIENYTYETVVNGAVQVGAMTINSNANLTFSGSGSVNVEGELTVSNGVGKTVTLNATGGFTVGTNISFTSSSTTFVNQQSLQVGGAITYTASNVSVTNNSTIIAGSLSSGFSGSSFTNAASAVFNVGSMTATGFVLNNSGTINQTGNFTTTGVTNLNNLNGATWNYSGTNTTNHLYCNNGTNTFNYNAPGAQSVSVPADAYSNLTFSGSGAKSLSGNIDVNGNISLEGSAQLAASSHGISLAGNWTVTSATASFTEGTGTVTLDGTADQTISTVAAGGETFYNLTVNKSAGNVVQSSATFTDVDVANTLTLTSGAWRLNGNTLSVTRSATNAIARTNGYIVSETTTAPYGEVRWSVGTSTGAFVFPFGTASANYIPFTFNVTTPGTGSGTVTLSTYPTSPENLPLPTDVTDVNTGNGADNSTNVVDRFWYITLDNYLANPVTTVTFTATAAEVGLITALRAQRWNSLTGKWDAPLAGQTYDAVAQTVTVPGVSNFSPWTVSGNSIPLPIELAYFNAVPKGDEVEIEWKTSQESNNDFFTIEKTRDAEQYHEVAVVPGAGTVNRSRTYRIADADPWTGISYYRLKQTDLDGTTRYFKPVMVDYAPSHALELDLFPVPSDGRVLNVEISGLKGSDALPVDVLNLNGEIVFSLRVDSQGKAKVKELLSFRERLAPGIYIMKVGQTLRKKFVVE